MVDAATEAAPRPTLRIARELTRTPMAYGDFTGLGTWFVLSMCYERVGTPGDVDVAA